MGSQIARLDALEILDSRGKPTVQVRIILQDGTEAIAAVPSGASTSVNEAVELRDGDPTRYAGLGVQRAVGNVTHQIAAALVGMDATDQEAIDQRLIGLDGTASKAILGANAILGVSMAVARAAAQSCGLPLYRYLARRDANRLPVPFLNVINGGKHAPNRLEFQEFMIVPHGAPSFSEAMRYAAETYAALRDLLSDAGMTVSVGDEGGSRPTCSGTKMLAK